MGNTNLPAYPQHYSQVKVHEHPILGRISHIRIQTPEENMLIMKTLQFKDQLQKQRVTVQLSKLIHLQQKKPCNNLLQVYTLSEQQFQDPFKIKICMEHLENDFYGYVKKLRTTRVLNEMKILALLKSIVNGMIYAYKSGLFLPLLNFHNILVGQGQQIKLIPINLCSQTYLKRNVYSQLQQYNNRSFVSPQILSELSKDCKSVEVNWKSQIFALGMIALSLCTDKNLYDYYNYSSFSINMKSILNLVKKIQYSNGFKQLIQGMIEPVQGLRFGLQSLIQVINLQSDNKCKKPATIKKNIKRVSITSLNNSFVLSKDVQKYTTTNQSIQPTTVLNCITKQQLNKMNEFNLPTEQSKEITNSFQCKKKSKIMKAQISIFCEKEKENIDNIPKQKKIQKMKQKKFNNGALYKGQLCQAEKFNGTGALYYPNGNLCYKGQWKNNNFHGIGILFHENMTVNKQLTINYQNFNMNSEKGAWIKYQGQFEDDKKHGFGVLLFRNGDLYEGKFFQDCIHGQGIYKQLSENGINIVRGIWQYNIMIKIV